MYPLVARYSVMLKRWTLRISLILTAGSIDGRVAMGLPLRQLRAKRSRAP